MIELNRLNGERIYLNLELIELIEETPNTVIRMTNGNKYIVIEKGEEIIDKIINFRKQVKNIF
ncbi:flagellar FlbD family protein [Clostridium sp. D2Q-11]|uniref:Flagellar FlbD family protein n=1 Tax=Anaeromonas frigoriresistens TaxID=2683708 RepID=A0A942V0X4_9FIRM|nr:flagellar FlbD family protein [Anaeromonas frigoriresistens]MBS4539851.1 flagellar FlbD family protein [Anaeromonas frigoriresistens]